MSQETLDTITALAKEARIAAEEAAHAAAVIAVKAQQGKLDVLNIAALQRAAGIADRNAEKINTLAKELTRL